MLSEMGDEERRRSRRGDWTLIAGSDELSGLCYAELISSRLVARALSLESKGDECDWMIG